MTRVSQVFPLKYFRRESGGRRGSSVSLESHQFCHAPSWVSMHAKHNSEHSAYVYRCVVKVSSFHTVCELFDRIQKGTLVISRTKFPTFDGDVGTPGPRTEHYPSNIQPTSSNFFASKTILVSRNGFRKANFPLKEVLN